jgi:hypothetical protein
MCVGQYHMPPDTEVSSWELKRIGETKVPKKQIGKRILDDSAEEPQAMAIGHDVIAALAYEFWLARGCPIGSPEVDWVRAEEELKSKAQLAALATVVSEIAAPEVPQNGPHESAKHAGVSSHRDRASVAV